MLVHTAGSRRRVYLGKDENTDFIQQIDDFTHDFYAGNQVVSRMTVFKFDFSQNIEILSKNYREILEPQIHGVGKKGSDFRRITAESLYSSQIGFGWASLDGLIYTDRGKPDPLRRDFIAGDRPNTFVVDLTAGRYRILIVSGDAAEANNTKIKVRLPEQEFAINSRSPKGVFATESFLMLLSADAPLKVELYCAHDISHWKLNTLIINKIP